MPGTVAEDFNQRGVVLINRVALHLEWFVFQGQGRSRRWGRGEAALCGGRCGWRVWGFGEKESHCPHGGSRATWALVQLPERGVEGSLSRLVYRMAPRLVMESGWFSEGIQSVRRIPDAFQNHLQGGEGGSAGV